MEASFLRFQIVGRQRRIGRTPIGPRGARQPHVPPGAECAFLNRRDGRVLFAPLARTMKVWDWVIRAQFGARTSERQARGGMGILWGRGSVVSEEFGRGRRGTVCKTVGWQIPAYSGSFFSVGCGVRFVVCRPSRKSPAILCSLSGALMGALSCRPVRWADDTRMRRRGSRGKSDPIRRRPADRSRAPLRITQALRKLRDTSRGAASRCLLPARKRGIGTGL